jgi:hypothetical protein
MTPEDRADILCDDIQGLVAAAIRAAITAAVAQERELIAARVYNATGLADLAAAIRAGGVICGRWSLCWQGAAPPPSSGSGGGSEVR